MAVTAAKVAVYDGAPSNDKTWMATYVAMTEERSALISFKLNEL